VTIYFLGKKNYFSFIVSVPVKNKNSCGYKKSTIKFLPPLPALLLLLDSGYAIGDPEWIKNQDPGSGIG
jgi:hypothetical protein